jgi:hypothetical protein
MIKKIVKSLMKYVIPIELYRDLHNLRMFMRNLSELRVPSHINHFKDIHQIVLSKDWAQRNMEHLMLMTYYPTLGDKNQINELRSREFKIYAQNGEDGLLLYIFSQIGINSRRCVNIGCGGSSNTANLVTNFGWRSLEIDGSAESVQRTKEFFMDKVGPKLANVAFKQCWVTKANINKVLEEADFAGEIDLLSIDIDGNDYWIWREIAVANPRVVLIEYNASLGPERSLTVEYDPNFDVAEKHPTRWYHGASLAALTKLGKRKGYALVGCESNGVNAFFVRKDLIAGKFREVTPGEAFYSHFQRSRRMSDDEQFAVINDLDFVEV